MHNNIFSLQCRTLINYEYEGLKESDFTLIGIPKSLFHLYYLSVKPIFDSHKGRHFKLSDQMILFLFIYYIKTGLTYKMLEDLFGIASSDLFRYFRFLGKKI